MMPRIKKYLSYPNDEPEILSLEKSVRSLLTSEMSSNNDRHLLQQYACDLSRTSGPETLKSDAIKVDEEKRLWTEIDPTSGNQEEKDGKGPESPLIQKAKKGVTQRRKNGALVTVGGGDSIGTSTITSNISSRINGISSRPPIGQTYSSSISDIHADKPPTWKTARVDKTKIAVVKPQPQVIITQRSPSPMPPKVEDNKSSSKLPLSSKNIY